MTPSSSLIGPARAFALAEGDLQAVSSRLETMHTECWHPAGSNRDRPTPHRDPNAGPDDVKAPKWDCGLGSEAARHCWTEMCGHLERAELDWLPLTEHEPRLLAVAKLLNATDAPLCVPYRATSLLDAQHGVQRLRIVLRATQRLHVRYGGAGPTVTPYGRAAVDSQGVDARRASWLFNCLKPVLENVKQAGDEAQRVVREVGTGKAPDACPQCRRLGSIGQPRKGGLCYSCYNRNERLRQLGTPRVRQTKVKAWKRSKAEAS